MFFRMNFEFSKCRVFQNCFPAIFAIRTLNFDEILSEFRDTSQKMQGYVEIRRNSHRYAAFFALMAVVTLVAAPPYLYYRGRRADRILGLCQFPARRYVPALSLPSTCKFVLDP